MSPLLPPVEGWWKIFCSVCDVPPLASDTQTLKRAISYVSGSQEGKKGLSFCQRHFRHHASSRTPCPTVEPGKCCTAHSDPTPGCLSFWVRSLRSTSLPHSGYIAASSGPACSVSGWLDLSRLSHWLTITIKLSHAIQFTWRPPKFRGIRFTTVLN